VCVCVCVCEKSVVRQVMSTWMENGKYWSCGLALHGMKLKGEPKFGYL
jgi:hypothetical protein